MDAPDGPTGKVDAVEQGRRLVTDRCPAVKRRPELERSDAVALVLVGFRPCVAVGVATRAQPVELPCPDQTSDLPRTEVSELQVGAADPGLRRGRHWPKCRDGRT